MLVNIHVLSRRSDIPDRHFKLETDRFFNTGETFSSNDKNYKVLGFYGQVSDVGDSRIDYDVEEV